MNSSLYFVGMINILPVPPSRTKHTQTQPNPQQTLNRLDFKKQRMMIDYNAVQVKGEFEFGTPKTGESRSVPMLDFIAFSLRRITKGRPQSAFVFGKVDSVPPIRPHAEYSWFASAVKAAMKEDETFPRVTPHDLRHTAASLAVSAGANPKAVQRMLGHASAAMTMDVYADLFEQDIDDVAANMSGARAKALSNKASKAS
ncbi:integrase [Leucobacter exalbidus]|uniref:Integrase n=1 Tax=Leucobacter exalbidus TaxID=662960 RepID=A0A940PT72_9MICO|nr:integrase [Leucobacter exalbidus]